MNTNPKVTVLMPIYNCDQYVGEAIDSILGQTFTDFEFLIIDDASTDKTVSIVKGYSDSRIKFIRKPKNTGYTNSLNYGLAMAKGAYIARMDGDDISLPERFAKQVTFMDAYPEVVACGTTYSIIGSGIIKKVPINHGDIKVQLLQKTCFGHPTVMLRKAVFEKFKVAYNSDREPAEDYDLWVRLLKYGKLANLPGVLLSYRVHDGQVSQNRTQIKRENTASIRLNLLKYLDYCFSLNEEQLLKKILLRNDILTLEEINNYLLLKLKLIESNKGFFKNEGLQKYFIDLQSVVLKDYFLKRKLFSLPIFVDYLTLGRKCNFKLPLMSMFKLLIKSVINFENKGS
ncbi:glycosyltransferase family 2 protein [Bizionia sp. M204]|uniref:glycosyltransferase family 2 protein n=1 Tax=Bizionia sp. M204 TaxID=2675331 RepID=UPI00205F4DF5|nr:glycosyltransferase family 2 protein [Bizionia sp. M204]UPS91675.1 glycosyltransferase [Bizionia sp. M204]